MGIWLTNQIIINVLHIVNPIHFFDTHLKAKINGDIITAVNATRRWLEQCSSKLHIAPCGKCSRDKATYTRSQ
ncbi:hypothetical protein D3C77_716550 [compost metagenome]